MMNCYRINDLHLGLSHQFTVTIGNEEQQLFHRLTGDDNLLHCDPLYAQKHGFHATVAYGLLTSSYYSTLVGVYLPGSNCVLQSIDVKFHRPVYLGDTLDVTGEVVYINEPLRVIEIKGLIRRGGNEKVSSAKISVGLFS